MSQKTTKSSYTSKGERASVSPVICKAVRRKRTLVEILLHKQHAWRKGRNPWISVPNGNTTDKKQRFVRVRANDYWGDPRSVFRMTLKES